MHSCCLFVAQNHETLDRQGFLIFVLESNYLSQQYRKAVSPHCVPDSDGIICIRKFEDGVADTDITCEDTDFQTAFALAESV